MPGLLWQGMTQPPDAANRECLARLGLDQPTTFAERGYRALVNAALARSEVAGAVGWAKRSVPTMLASD